MAVPPHAEAEKESQQGKRVEGTEDTGKGDGIEG